MHNVSSSYFDAASLLTVALFPPSSGLLGGMRGLAWRAWSDLPSNEQLHLASSGNQFSKIGHI